MEAEGTIGSMAAAEGVVDRYVEEVGHHLDVWAVSHAGWSVELPSHCMAVLVAAEHEEEDTRVLQGVVADQVHDLEDALEHVLEGGLEGELQRELEDELEGESEGELEGGTVREMVREAVRGPAHEPVPGEAAAPDVPEHAVAMRSSLGLDGSQPAVSAGCEGPGPTLV